MRPRRGLLLGLTTLAVLLCAAAPAAAQPDTDDPPPGERSRFVRDSVIYPNTVDGWACHFLGQCRAPGERSATDPGPIAVVPDGQDVDVVCVFGSYAKVAITPGPPAGAPRASGTAPSAAPQSSAPAAEPTQTPSPVPTPSPAAVPPNRAAPSPSPSVIPPATTSPPATSPSTSPAEPGGAAQRPGSVPLPPFRSSTAPADPPAAVVGHPPPVAKPVAGWAPVADIDTPTDRRPVRCSVEQWAW